MISFCCPHCNKATSFDDYLTPGAINVLSPGQLQIMLLLASRPYRRYTDKEIARVVYGDAEYTSQVRRQITLIRRKLGPVITTSYGNGYKLRKPTAIAAALTEDDK